MVLMAVLFSSSFLLQACSAETDRVPEVSVEQIMAFADSQLRILIDETDAAIERNPIGNRGAHVNSRAVRDGELFIIPSRDWTSGFMPGMLWYMYEYTGDDYWREHAIRHTLRIEPEKRNNSNHDMGFKIYCSFGNGYRLLSDPHYREVIITASEYLIERYNPTVGAIRSWDHNTDKWDYPVIIDNMMNLEMLFRATQLTGDSTFYNVAVSHARTSMAELFREDHSSYHVVGFNPETGEVVARHTHQGAFHESAWARGQAWALYGFAMAYRFTGYPEFLEKAENVADFFLNHPRLPADLVPFWDFDDPNIPNTAMDVSSATIVASALYELSTMVPARSAHYKGYADRMLAGVFHNYRSPDGTNFGFLLEKSTGHLPHGYEIDVPLIYADYYFLEAALRKMRLEQQ